MKFILFAGHTHYPKGGADDFYGFHETIEDAKAAFIENKDQIKGDRYLDNWGQIVEAETMTTLLIARMERSRVFSDDEWFLPEQNGWR